MSSRRQGHTKVLWALLAGIFGVGGLLFVTIVAVAAAVLGASLTGCEGGAGEAAAASSGPAPSAYALQSIPSARLRLYQQAGARFNINWAFLASIGTQECGSGECAGTNSAGCAGPMQIAYVRGSPCSPGSGPTLWERFAVDADPTQPLSINDPADATFTAARIMRQDMGAPPIGGSYAQYRQAACNYYGACGEGTIAYAEEVMARAVQYGFAGAGSPPPTSSQLAQPATGGEQCSASVLAPEAASQSAIVKVAESQIGQGEHPPGSDCTVYGPCEEWCSLFASWVWQHAGVPLPGSTSLYGYSGALYERAKEHGGRVLPATARPSPGDAVFYGTGPSESAHVGIVVRVLPNGEIETVEGNYAGHVTRVGPFPPAHPVGERAPIYGYAQPPAPNNAGSA
ncbi:MAG TPA: CHAP domain-containing protein [Solirubrobacteraceae bacterium]|nr:CHAP domain-containing protein [Solirubrobacteraceae bacterium]